MEQVTWSKQSARTNLPFVLLMGWLPAEQTFPGFIQLTAS